MSVRVVVHATCDRCKATTEIDSVFDGTTPPREWPYYNGALVEVRMPLGRGYSAAHSDLCRECADALSVNARKFLKLSKEAGE